MVGVGGMVGEAVPVCLRRLLVSDVVGFLVRGVDRCKSVGRRLYTLLGEIKENGSEGSCDGTTFTIVSNRMGGNLGWGKGEELLVGDMCNGGFGGLWRSYGGLQMRQCREIVC